MRGIYQIYIERYFFSLFVFHTCIWELTSAFYSGHCSHRRILLTSLVTAFLSGLCLLLPLTLFFRLLSGVIITTLVCFYQAYYFSKMTGYGFLRWLLISLFMSCLLGGVLGILQKIFLSYHAGTTVLLICAVLSAVFIRLLLHHFLHETENMLYPVVLCNGDKRFELTAFLDTGNGLIEPVSGKPVSLVEKEILPMLNVCEEKIKVIPYRSLGKKKGLLYGYEIERLIIQKKEQRVEIDKPVIAAQNMIFHECGSYQMLLHPTLLKY